MRYYNDEWNGSIIDNPELRKWQELYRITLMKVEKLLEEELNKNHSNGITTLPNNYRELECRCDVSRPNSFTGNCTNCNLIIKPIRNKDADKYSK
jgi:hypothetical protein